MKVGILGSGKGPVAADVLRAAGAASLAGKTVIDTTNRSPTYRPPTEC